jgi:hypothetical protein
MKVVFWMVIILFACKLLWNVSVPYVLGLQLLKGNGTRTRGVSLVPWVEGLLLVAIGFLSAGTVGEGWLYRPFWVLSVGLVGVAISYIHLFVIGAVFGALSARLTAARRKN